MKGAGQSRGRFSQMITSQGRVRIERGIPQPARLGQHRNTGAPTVGTPDIPALPCAPSPSWHPCTALPSLYPDTHPGTAE